MLSFAEQGTYTLSYADTGCKAFDKNSLNASDLL